MNGPVVLVIVGGFGIGTGGEEDATARALSPFFDRAYRLYPHARLETSGPAVGLPEGQMGSSEQLRIAESEKYPHVTYFFNGGREAPFSLEDRILVPSPNDVPTYDLKPEMSAVEVTDRLLEALDRETYGFVLVNYANPDMVGQTGSLEAAIRAVEVVDACLDRVTAAVLGRGGTLLITSDHGNLERMIAPESGSPRPAHTTGAVPIFWVTDPVDGRGITDGGLADVAPSVCKLVNIEVPEEMSGRCLLVGDPSFSNS